MRLRAVFALSLAALGCGGGTSGDDEEGANASDALMQVEPATVLWTDRGSHPPRLAHAGATLLIRAANGSRIVSLDAASSATRTVSGGAVLSPAASTATGAVWLERSPDGAEARLLRAATHGAVEVRASGLELDGALVAADDVDAYVARRDGDGSAYVAHVRAGEAPRRLATICAERSDCAAQRMALDAAALYVAVGGAGGGASVLRVDRASGQNAPLPLRGSGTIVDTRIADLAVDEQYVFIALGGQGLLRFDKARQASSMVWVEAADSPLAMDASYVYFRTKWGDVFSLDKAARFPPQRVARLPEGSAFDFVLGAGTLYASMQDPLGEARVVGAPLTPRRPERAR